MELLKLFARRKYDTGQVEAPRTLFRRTGGTLVSPETSMQASAYYRGVIYISTQIAKLPWHIKDGDNAVKKDHPYAKLLNTAPNPEMSAFNFKCAMVASAINKGNGYAEIERNVSGKVIGLWPMDNYDVQPSRLPSGELVYRVVGGGTNSNDVYLRKEDVFHVRNLHTHDGIVGQGTVHYAAETLGIALGADKMANSLYSNGGMPSGVLTIDGKLSPEAAKRIKESWEENHTGRKVGGTALLEEGLGYQAISHSPDILQFLESRKFSVSEIARFLGVPPTKLFDAEASTYNNIEHSNLEVATDTLDAWARNLESEADMKLLVNSRGGMRSEMDLHAIFRGDMKTRGDYFTKRMQTGSITPNQIREMEGDAPYPDGDRYFIATNNFTPADRMDEVLDSQIKQKESGKEDEEIKETEKEIQRAALNYYNKN